MWIVDKLWNGEVIPCERPVGQIAGFQECMREASESEKRLLEVIPPESRTVYDDYFQKHTAVGAMLEQEAFAQGFQMAGLIMLDIVAGQ